MLGLNISFTNDALMFFLLALSFIAGVWVLIQGTRTRHRVVGIIMLLFAVVFAQGAALSEFGNIIIGPNGAETRMNNEAARLSSPQQATQHLQTAPPLQGPDVQGASDTTRIESTGAVQHPESATNWNAVARLVAFALLPLFIWVAARFGLPAATRVKRQMLRYRYRRSGLIQ